MTNIRILAALSCVLAVTACEKNRIQDIDGPETGGVRIKFHNFSVGSPQVNFYANETKMTAVLSATGIELTTGVAYGSVAAGGFYSSLEPGAYTLSGRIAATVDKNLPITNQATTLVDGISYSYFLSGIYNTTTKQTDGFILEDPYPAQIDFTRAYVRFVNASHNANPARLIATAIAPGTIVDTIGALVTYKNANVYETVVPGTYDLVARNDLSVTNLATTGTTPVAFLAGRVYTISLRGNITTASTMALNASANR